jgi:hypothetical protein
MLATATEVARTESMTLGQIARHIEVVHGEPMPCALETLSVALRREGFSFKRNRFFAQKKRPVFAESRTQTMNRLSPILT